MLLSASFCNTWSTFSLILKLERTSLFLFDASLGVTFTQSWLVTISASFVESRKAYLYRILSEYTSMANKVAIISLVDPFIDPDRIHHAFEYIFDMKNNGIQAHLYLDGASVKMVDFVQKNPSHEISPLYDRVLREGFLGGACNFCAAAFKVKEQIIGSNVKLSPENKHTQIGQLINEGYQIITI